MPSLEALTENDLHGVLNDQSLRKARGYQNSIYNPVRAGELLSAQVRGTYLYQVEVEVLPGGIHAQCTCPYSWGGYCKHIGALLIKWMEAPGAFAVEAPATTLPGFPLPVTPVEPPPTQRPGKPPAWLADGFEERQQRDRQQLAQWLDNITIQDLRDLAKRRGWKVRGSRKAEVVGQVLAQIEDAGDLRRTIAGLDHEHSQVLRAMLVLGDDQVHPDDLARLALTWGDLNRHKQIETYSRHLVEQGLALPWSVKNDYPDTQIDFVPPTLARRFPPLLEGVVPASYDLPDDSAASGLQLADSSTLVRSAGQLLLLLEQAPVPLRSPMPRPRLERFHRELQGWDYDPLELVEAEREGLLTARRGADLALTIPPPPLPLTDPDLARLAPIVGGEAQLEFLYALLLTAGLVQPGSPITVWPEVKAEFLRRDELAQRALLARHYFGTAAWSELWPLLRADGSLRLKHAWRYSYLKPERLRVDLVRFRHRLLRALACLPDDRWVQIADLESMLRVAWPRFDAQVWETYRHPDATGNWFLARNGLPLSPADPDDWRAGQGAFLQQAIAGPLHWLGLADLHFDGPQLVAFRLHGLADFYWDRVDVPGAPRHAAGPVQAGAVADAVVAGEQTIAVTPSLVSAQAHSLLDRIARLEATGLDRFVYRLDAQAAYQAFEDGAVLGDLLAEWERLLVIPVPQAISEQLAAWWAAYGRLRLYENLTVVEFGDDYALAEMKAATSLEQLLVAEVSPRLVIVRPEDAGRLVAELEKAGYTPKQTDEV
ncbi:MAG: helicase-associated domain-containing protein [Anaerolineae bacterium]|nr:helicase-associated domain-containing protein [Anaerolineae bacterium]